jgi:hypothetical protein
VSASPGAATSENEPDRLSRYKARQALVIIGIVKHYMVVIRNGALFKPIFCSRGLPFPARMEEHEFLTSDRSRAL